MKKILFLIYMMLVPLYSVFGQTQIGVSIHDTTIVVGQEAYIPIYVDSSLTGQNVSSFNFDLSFNDYYCTFDSVITTGTMTDGWGSISYNLVNGSRILIAGASQNSLSGSGILFYLRVNSYRSGGTYLSFTNNGGNYFNEGTPAVILDDGYISIQNPPSITVTPNSSIIVVGDSENFNVYGGTAPYTWSLSNPFIATIDSNGTLSALEKGFTKVICTDSTGVTDTTDGNIEIRAFRLSTRDTAFFQGNTVDIPIYTSDLTGLNYTAGQIVMSLDAEDLTPIEIINSGTLTASYSTPQFSFTNGILSIAFAGNTPLSGEGVLLIVRFQISSVSTGGTYLNFNNILFNESDLGLGEGSYFDILPLATINISPSTATLLAGETQAFIASSGTPPYSWSVSNPALASIDTAGVLSALKGGVVTVNVSDAYGGSGTSNNIYIYDTEVSLPDTTLDLSGSVDVPLEIGNLTPGFSVVSLQGEISFDSSKVRFDGVVTSGTLTNGWSFSINNSGNKIVFAGAGSVGFNSSGTIVKLRFVPSSSAINGNYSNLTINTFMMNEGSPNALTNNGKITITNTSPPLPPSGLSAVVVAPDKIALMWTDNSSNEIGFSLERTQDTTGTWAVITILPENTTSYVDSGLTDGRAFYYRIRANNYNGYSLYSNIAGVFTPLSAPTNLNGTLVAFGTLDLTWDDNSSSETGYILERKEYTTSFSLLAILDSNTTTYRDSNLTEGEEYTYRVRAYNDSDSSDYSNNYIILVTNPFPAPPSNLIATTLDSAAIGLTWLDESNNEDGFILERKMGETGSWALTDSLPANTTEFNDSGLLDGMLYYYRVYAYNSFANSAYSNVDTAITVMNPPRSLVATNPSNNVVQLNWSDYSQSELGFIIERAEGTIGNSLLFTPIDTTLANETSYLDSNLTTGNSYVYKVRGYNNYALSVYSNLAPVTLVGVSEQNEVPTRYEVFQNYPNPFSKSSSGGSSTVVKYNLPERSNVRIVVYSLLGRKIRTLESGTYEAGTHNITWRAEGIPSGVYLIYFSFESSSNHTFHTFTKKAVLVK